jgi:hypothetical protein
MTVDNAFVLSIDGGGIRGVIPAANLVDLEKRLARAGKTKPLCRYFDALEELARRIISRQSDDLDNVVTRLREIGI